MNGAGTRRTAGEVLEQLPEIPGGRELLSLAGPENEATLVGGAVRDLLRGERPRELDVTVAGDAAAFAARMLEALSTREGERAPELTTHERFGTASVRWPRGRVDVAERREESYAAPGALPDVRPGTVERDLARRDFTVNAIALPLTGANAGELLTVEHALEDLETGQLRVLHDASFWDDPTRMLRLARYSARLGFAVEAHTRELALEALAAGALETVSGGRISVELARAALEGDRDAFVKFGEIGILAALGLPGSFDAELAAGAGAVMSVPDGHTEDVLMAVAFHPPADDGPAARAAAAKLLERLEHPAPGRAQILASAFGVNERAAALRADTPPSRLRELLGDLRVDGVAIVGALAERANPGAAEAACRWLEDLRELRLQIDGDDLIAAGVPRGPRIGEALERVLARRLDGELEPGREAELRAALEVVG